MQFPDDLPEVIDYYVPPIAGVGMEDVWVTRSGVRRTSRGHVLHAYPRRPVKFVGSSGCTDAGGWCQVIPHAATHFRAGGYREGKWQRIAEMPPSWLPFVQRQRGSVMDPRSPPCPNCGRDAAVYGQPCPRCVLKQQASQSSDQ